MHIDNRTVFLKAQILTSHVKTYVSAIEEPRIKLIPEKNCTKFCIDTCEQSRAMINFFQRELMVL